METIRTDVLVVGAGCKSRMATACGVRAAAGLMGSESPLVMIAPMADPRPSSFPPLASTRGWTAPR